MANYTSGIRKIYKCLRFTSLAEMPEIVKAAGYSAFLFNGSVYVIDNNGKPLITPLIIEDFELS